jgi:hypothetical protein
MLASTVFWLAYTGPELAVGAESTAWNSNTDIRTYGHTEPIRPMKSSEVWNVVKCRFTFQWKKDRIHILIYSDPWIHTRTEIVGLCVSRCSDAGAYSSIQVRESEYVWRKYKTCKFLSRKVCVYIGIHVYCTSFKHLQQKNLARWYEMTLPTRDKVAHIFRSLIRILSSKK